jgi:hypothetical protein
MYIVMPALLQVGIKLREASQRRDVVLHPSLTHDIRNVSHHIKRNPKLFIPWHGIHAQRSEVSQPDAFITVHPVMHAER